MFATTVVAAVAVYSFFIAVLALSICVSSRFYSDELDLVSGSMRQIARKYAKLLAKMPYAIA